MDVVLWTLLTIGLAILAGISSWAYVRDRARRKQQNPFSRWPIPRVSLPELDPVFRPNALGPTHATEVTMIGGVDLLPIVGATSDLEAWILAVLSKRAKTLFEFGTASGRTSYLWARNSPDDARIATLTLGPSEMSSYRTEAGDAEADVRNALEESAFSSFYYTGTHVASKITQLYGDSKAFDEAPWIGQCDVVFVDGSHAMSYVQNDSRKALKMVRPGGVILWHDYRGPRLPGVYDALNVLARTLPLKHIAGTSLVFYRRPA